MSDMETSDAFDKAALRKCYDGYAPLLSAALEILAKRVKAALRLQTEPLIKQRVKEFDSYCKKVQRVKPAGTPVLTDLVGIRVICAFLEDLTAVERQVAEHFRVLEVERKGAQQAFFEFGYESIHILIQLPPDVAAEALEASSVEPPLCEALRDMPCEIQVRTILQDAWAEVEHELVYKSEFSPFDLPLKRKLASVNASLTLADIIFQEIRDYQNKLNSELDFRRNSFYSKTDRLSHTLLGDSGEAASAPLHEALVSPFIRGTIDDMVLDALHAHNSGDFSGAVEIYTKIIAFKPEPNAAALSVIYKHRGMAYFAQSEYRDALADFTRSISCSPNNYRSLYYAGIVHSIQGEHREAVAFFDKSLEQNGCQSHVHYRKALAEYQLGEYQDALRELDSAKKLGLDDEDARQLRARLVEKFDMKV